MDTVLDQTNVVVMKDGLSELTILALNQCADLDVKMIRIVYHLEYVIVVFITVEFCVRFLFVFLLVNTEIVLLLLKT